MSATHLTEVGERCILDAIPSQHILIDADLSTGMIYDETSQLRYRELE